MDTQVLADSFQAMGVTFGQYIAVALPVVLGIVAILLGIRWAIGFAKAHTKVK